MAAELEKSYQPKDVEAKIYQAWEKSGFFNPDNLPGKRKKSFCISMPPPNVTGELHLGHATGITIEDILTRYHRMLGDKALYLPGTDHASISTQFMVEKLIASEGLNKQKLGREKFLQRVWLWKEKYGSRITQQIRQLGASCDWSREHFTMDETLTKAVQTAFIAMYKDGLIYRGQRIVNWCPRCASAISDLEVKHQENTSKLWHIRYPLFGSTKYLVVATTRPETMLGDAAVAVHPEDARYAKYLGQKIILPLVNREIPIVTDERVDIKFGTGAVKVTPAHDHLDYEIGQTHQLPIINVIGQDNKMTKEAGEFYGLSVQEARRQILEKLEEEELLEKIEDYTHNLARCERCGAPIEPLISKQWFIKTKKLAQPAQEAVKKGRVKIIPQRYEKVYFHWMNNIKDWCISRQLWWGHQMPVWYCGKSEDLPTSRMGFAGDVASQLFKGKTVTFRLRDHRFAVGDRVMFENGANGKLLGIGTIKSTQKVTVGTLPLQDKAHFATYIKRKELTARLRIHYPTKRITSSTPAWIYIYSFQPHDPNRGCGETIVSTYKPKFCPNCKKSKFLRQDEDTLDTWFSSGLWTFSTLGWPKKTKDLKVFHPTNVMETGWDILFFWVARMMMMSLYFLKRVPFKTVYLHGLVLDREGRKMSKSKGTGVDPIPMMEKYGTDAIRLSLVLGTTAGQDFRLFEEKIAGYRNFVNKLWNVARFILSQEKKSTNKLIIKSLADKWIISRLQKLISQVTADIEAYRFSEAGTAIYEFLWHELADWYLEISKIEKNYSVAPYILDKTLKLAHPFMPFVTEEIWTRWHGQKKTNLLMIQAWPKAEKKLIDATAEKQFSLIKELVVRLRNFRSEQRLSPQKKISVFYWGAQENFIKENKAIIRLLANLDNFNLGKKEKVTGSLPGLQYYIDFKHDQSMVKKEVAMISQYIQKIEAKLSNENFLKNAPADVVAKEKQKLAEQQERLKKLL